MAKYHTVLWLSLLKVGLTAHQSGDAEVSGKGRSCWRLLLWILCINHCASSSKRCMQKKSKIKNKSKEKTFHLSTNHFFSLHGEPGIIMPCLTFLF